MNDFKTYFNPLVPIGRLAFSIFSGGLTCFVIYLLFRDFNTNGLKQYLSIILGATIFGAIFQMFFKAFITTTKNYLNLSRILFRYTEVKFKIVHNAFLFKS